MGAITTFEESLRLPMLRGLSSIREAIRSGEKLPPDRTRAKRNRHLAVLLFCLALLISSCGDTDSESDHPAGDPERNGDSQAPVGSGPSPTPLRPPPELPDKPPSAVEKFQFYVRLLQSGDEDQIVWAWAEVQRAGSRTVPYLAKALDIALVKNKYLAENILNCFVRGLDGAAAIRQLNRAASDNDARLRLVAAKSFGHMKSDLAVPALLDLLSDSYGPVSQAAVASIERLVREDATRGLLGRFPDGIHPRAQSEAVRVLSTLLPEAEARSFLLSTLESKDPALVISAARNLCRIDPGSGSTVRSRLREVMEKYANSGLIHAVEDVLATARDPVLLESLPGRLDAANPSTAIRTVRLLSMYDAPVSAKVLWELARKRTGELRREALHALREIGDADALQYCLSLLESMETQDRYDAALLLGLFRDPLALPTAIKVLGKEVDLRVRLKLGHALALIGDPAGSAALAAILLSEARTDPSTAVLAFNAAGSLLRFQEISSEATAMLITASRSENPAIRLNAAKVLGPKATSSAARDALAALLSDTSIDVRRVAVAACLASRGSTVDSLVKASVSERDDRLAKVMARAALQLVHRWK